MTVSDHKLGRYTLTAELGKGGMGTVYAARDEGLGREVAIKVISPELASDPGFAARFLREARIAATIEHPNIVPVYEAGEIDGTLFIAMRLIRGMSLEDAIARSGRLKLPRVVRIARQLGGALDAVHARGLVHRDVKPANVLLTGGGPDEHTYLADFGLARETASSSGMTESGHWIGTLDFIAPEILDGGQPSARSDVYSMACLLFHAMSGAVPYPGPMTRKLAGHSGEALPSIGGGSQALDAVLQRGAAKDPYARYDSAGALARALEAAAGSRTGTAWTPVASRSRVRPPSSPTLRRGAPDPHATALDQLRPPAPPTPTESASPPAGGDRRKLFVGIVVAAVIVAAGVGAALALTRHGGAPAATTTTQTSATRTKPQVVKTSAFKRQASTIAASVQPSLDALAAAARTTVATDPASLDSLRSSAERALSDLGTALVDLRALDVAAQDRPDANALEAALDADVSLARAMAARRIRTAQLGPLGLAASQATGALRATVLPEVQVDDLIGGLKRARSSHPDTTGGGNDAGTVVLEPYTGKGFQALLPTGGGWGEPVTSEPEPDKIFRTTVRGPGGAVVLVDYTPNEPAVFGQTYTSRAEVDQPAFGSATEFLFKHSKVPECSTSQCVDYIMNDDTTGEGFAVLGGGGDVSVTIPLARKVMESLTPQG